MRRYTFDEIQSLDQALLQLAIYEVTQGRLLIAKDMDEMVRICDQSAEKFNEFKRLIQDGDCSFEFIKNTVLAKNGPIPRKEWETDNIEKPTYHAWIQDSNDSNNDEKDERLVNEVIKSLMSSFSDIMKNSEKNNEPTATNDPPSSSTKPKKPPKHSEDDK